MDQEHENIR